MEERCSPAMPEERKDCKSWVCVVKTESRKDRIGGEGEREGKRSKAPAVLVVPA